MKKNNILFVDDESAVLEGLEMMLYKQRQRWKMQFAPSGAEALELIKEKAIDVVVSDMRMPGMNGIEFLTQVKKQSPATVRMMLTGNTDLETAVQAVNKGQVFRFINKPCESDVLIKLIEGGLEYHRLIVAEKELLTQTLSGSIKLLTDLLALLDGDLFQDALLMRDMVKTVVERLRLKNAWEVMLAAMLSRLGYISLPKELLEKMRRGQELTPQEQEMVDQGAEVGYNLLRQIPRLEGVARIVRYQHKCFDGSGFPQDEVCATAIPIGARILKILGDYIDLNRRGKDKNSMRLRTNISQYDDELLEKILPLVKLVPID